MTARASILYALATAGRLLPKKALVAAVYGPGTPLPPDAEKVIRNALKSLARKPVGGKTVVRVGYGIYALLPVEKSTGPARRVAESLVGSSVTVA